MMNQPTYTYADIASPSGAASVVTGINDLGQLVGYYSVGASQIGFPSQIGFLYSAGVYSAVSYPINTFLQNPDLTFTLVADHADWTKPDAINDAGEIVGYFGSVNSSPFLFSGGTYTVLSAIGLFGVGIAGINNAGQIVGALGDVAAPHAVGFLYSGGAYTTFQDPLATGATFATDINNVGQIVGYYFDNSVAHGFLYKDGIYTTVDDPLANGGTYLTGINDAGQIVGYYEVGGQEHGFLYADGVFTTLDNPLGVRGTSLTGINNSGQIVGNYLDRSSLRACGDDWHDCLRTHGVFAR